MGLISQSKFTHYGVDIIIQKKKRLWDYYFFTTNSGNLHEAETHFHSPLHLCVCMCNIYIHLHIRIGNDTFKMSP